MSKKPSKLILTLSLFTLLLGAVTLTSLFVGYKISNHRSSEFATKKQTSYRENRIALEKTLNVKGRTVFIGDSLIAGAPWNELFPNLKVSVRGYDGMTTEEIKPLVKTVSTQKPNTVIVMAGINDVYTKMSAKKTCENLTHIAQTLQENQVETLVILPFPSIKYGKVDFTQGAKDIAKCMIPQDLGSHITLLDLTDIMTDGNKMKPEYTYDGVHLTSDGYQKWATHIKKFLKN